MLDWLLGHQVVFDEFIVWLVVGGMLLYLLSQAYVLDGLTLAVLVFFLFIGVLTIKEGGLHHVLP